MGSSADYFHEQEQERLFNREIKQAEEMGVSLKLARDITSLLNFLSEKDSEYSHKFGKGLKNHVERLEKYRLK